MFQRRSRLSYANVMSTIAVFLALGGATALAASQLGKNTVGTKQLKANSVSAAKLKRNAVTEKKVRNNAITTAKIQDGAVTGAKVQTATLGTVPSAATLSGYSRKGIVRVAPSPNAGSVAASQAASPEVPLLSAGPFTVYGKCFEATPNNTRGAVVIRSSENGAILDSDLDRLTGSEAFLDATTPEEDRELASRSATDTAEYFGAHPPEFAAMSPRGTVVHGEFQIAVKDDPSPAGNGVYGAGNVCLFAAEMTALNG